jgi:hypothetical protein
MHSSSSAKISIGPAGDKLMKRLGVVKIATIMFAIMAGCVTFQASWIAWMDMPYVLRSLLTIGGGMVSGYMASILLILGIEADNSF